MQSIKYQRAQKRALILVRSRCERLGALPEVKHGPVLDAMFSLKEPKTGADGTMSWTVDVLNPGTHDNFHGKHGGDQTSLRIDNGAILEGTLGTRALRLVEEWRSVHQAELLEDWTRAQARQPLNKIEPLA